uniref:Si:dkey-11m19.5 n=1 Tax=Oryzias latipes TaxID=8090 RepID=A0A3P9KH25_ORYLA
MFFISLFCFLGQQLLLIEKKVTAQLTEQIRLQSESLVSDLESITAELGTEPQGIRDFSKYAFRVRETVKMLADMQKRLEYVLSLHGTVSTISRKMTEQSFEQKMLDVWGSFMTLLKQADSHVCRHLPSVAHALEKMFSCFICHLKNLIFKATSGPFLDSSQNAIEMASKLKYLCVHVQTVSAQLEELNRSSQNLQENTMDLNILTTDVLKVIARKELWQLRAAYTTWMEEWRKLLLSEVVVSEAKEKISKWMQQIQCLTNIPADDPVMQETVEVLESLTLQVGVIMKLHSTSLREKHWKAILQGMGLQCVLEKKLTVAEVMSSQLKTHQKLIYDTCRDAETEWSMEQAFQKLCLEWKDRRFQVEEFFLPAWQHSVSQNGPTADKDMRANDHSESDSTSKGPRFIITGLETLPAEINRGLSTLSTMIKSRYCNEFRPQLKEWIWAFQELGELIDLFKRHQQLWAFLTKSFDETSIRDQREHLLKRFQPVDKTYREIINTVLTDPLMVNLVSSETNDNKICQSLMDGLSTMEAIFCQTVDILPTLCDQFPRLWFLSDSEVIELLSYQQTPFTLQPFVYKLFQGVCWLAFDSKLSSNTNDGKSCAASTQGQKEMNVSGVLGTFQEQVVFCPSLEVDPDTLAWLFSFEKQLKLTIKRLMKKCAVQQNQIEPFVLDSPCDKAETEIQAHYSHHKENALTVLGLLSEFPLQCLLVAEEVNWCRIVLQAFQKTSLVGLRNLKAHNLAKLKNLGETIRGTFNGSEMTPQVSKHSSMCLRALVHLTMNHAQQLSRLMEVPHDPELSFEWISLMKYHFNSEDQNALDSDDLMCYVDVLDHRFQYGFEYFGPEDWVMVHTPSTDQAILGILMALKSYRSGFVIRNSMSGQNHTIVQLGKALGQQIIVKQCYPSTTPGFVQQMLLGALHTGAWLLLDSVDLLPKGVMSLLGKLLADIHQFFARLQENRKLRLNDEQEHIETESHIVLAGKCISPCPTYGCILISEENASMVSENLLRSVRPIALKHPDYRVIAEVMLTSIGFQEAKSLSHRLVSLLLLAKDSNCLPEHFLDENSCFLAVLQKVVSASEVHLRHGKSQRQTPNEPSVLTPEKSESTSSRNGEKDKKETAKTTKLHCRQMSLKQALMEETAIVKAILCIFITEQKKASQFNAIFKEAFPIAYQFPHFQQYMHEEERNQIQNAISEELQQQHLHCDVETISNALTLYQTLKFSQAVMLVGASGSGKTTCYKALSGALHRLQESENKCKNENNSATNFVFETPKWSSVETRVFFPNTMTYEELFGCVSETKSWKDGVFVKVLRDLEHDPTCSDVHFKKRDGPSKVKWLVMDGESVGQPGWLDYITSLCSVQDRRVCLPSGETFLAPSNLILLMEMTDLQDVSPAAVTRCSLIYFMGTDVWKAVWKSEMEAFALENQLDQKTMKMWNCLAKNLFSKTVALLEQNDLKAVNHSERGSSKRNGLQEITSFFRILQALYKDLMKQLQKPKTSLNADRKDGITAADTDGLGKKELLTRNIFLVAYIWGFAGHLHPSHWPQFDLSVRQLLSTCSYKIVVPDEISVFDNFFNFECEMCQKKAQPTTSIIPKYGKYRHLLNLMLKANQPVLLVGDPGSGKSTLCKSVLGLDKPYISIPGSPLLSSRDLRLILNNICSRKQCKYVQETTAKKPSLLLFVDDLHEAPRDVCGKMSAALETIRQSLSKGEFLTSDTSLQKSLSPGAVNYLATCCFCAPADPSSSVVSLRLSRLLSIFVLPTLSVDAILSMHSPWLKGWLKEIPLKYSPEDLSQCIITATKHLFVTLCDQFQSTAQRPQFMFSQSDLQKVFLGMCLWKWDISKTTPQKHVLTGCSPGSVLHVVHLWMHECMRTFSDRLCSDDDRDLFLSLLVGTAATHYGTILVDDYQPGKLDNSPARASTVDPALTCPNVKLAERTGSSSPSESIFPTDIKSPPALTEIIQHFKVTVPQLTYCPRPFDAVKFTNLQCSYEEMCSYYEQDVNDVLEELNMLTDRRGANVFNDTSRYIVPRQGVSQLLHILRALLIPWGHGVLMSSVRGTGRKTTVRLAAYLTGCQLMEVHSGNEKELDEILKEARDKIRTDMVKVIILVHEEVSSSVREKLLMAMAQRTYPVHHTEDELKSLVSRVTQSRRDCMDSWISDRCMGQIYRNIHAFLLMPFVQPNCCEKPANYETQRAQLTKALKLSCCVEVFQMLSNHSLIEIAIQCLKVHPFKIAVGDSAESLSLAMAGIHQSACQYASVLLGVQAFSTQTFVEFITRFVCLYNKLLKQWKNKNNRLYCSVVHLNVLNNIIVQARENVVKLQEEVATKQQHEKELLGALEDQKNLLELAVQKCETEENQLERLKEQLNQSVQQAKSLFLLRLRILESLDPHDLEEVHHYRDPPEGVVRVINSICLLFNLPPGWESAKHLLGQPNFMEELEFFDCRTVTTEQLQQLEEIIQSPHFEPESVREVSKACESLCRWVLLVYEYCCKRHQLLLQQQMEVLVREAESQVHLAKQQKKEDYQCLEDLQLKIQAVQCELDRHLADLHKAESHEKDISIYDGKFEKQFREWSSDCEKADLRQKNLPGDALILAAVISYSGPFGPDIRTELLNKWRDLCLTGDIDINPTDVRTALFTREDADLISPPPGFPICVTERLQLPIGEAVGLNEWQLENTLSARLLVKLLLWGHKESCGQHCPLLADTHQHLQMISHGRLSTDENVTLEKEVGLDLVVCADDPELLEKLDCAAEKGLKVLVTHAERANPSPEFLKKLMRPAGCWFQGSQQLAQPHPSRFHIILSTHLPITLLKSGIHASILAEVHVVDLSLSSKEIQELMLTQLLPPEDGELLIQHLRLKNYNQLLRGKMAAEKDAVMDHILQSGPLLHKDSDLLPRMAAFEEEMRKIQLEIERVSEELEGHECLLAAPRRLMELPVGLYQALQAVSRLSPTYYFSLQGFIKVMQEALWEIDKPSLLCISGKAANSAIPEIMNTMVLQLLVHYRPCLFHSHAAVLKLLALLALLNHNNFCSEAERLAFIRGLEDLEQPVTENKLSDVSAITLPSWIPPHIYSQLLLLEQIPSFIGLIASLCTSPMQWKEYLSLPSSTVVGTVPCRSHSHLSLLQRVLLWKTIVPNCLEGLASTLEECLLCLPDRAELTEPPHAGNPEVLARYLVNHEGPVILSLPNPKGQTTIQPLSLISQLSQWVVGKNKVILKDFTSTFCDFPQMHLS